MATSGRINSGSYSSSYFYFQWQLASQSTPNNTTTINWQWGLNTSGGSYWQTNAVKSISGYINSGQAIGGNTWSNIGGPYSGNGDHQLLSGSWTIGHNSDGTKNFSMSSTGWLYQGGNFSNSGSWDLPTIPRHAVLTALSMDGGGITAYDEGPMWLEFSNPAGTAVDAFIDDPTGRARTNANASSRHNFVFDAALIQHLQQSSPNSNTFNINIGVHDSLGGDNYDYRVRTVTIKNDAGQADPTFSDFTYLDTNSATVTITGSNQVLIQGKSTLQVTVPVANKATANKYATMDSYGFTIGGYSQTSPWSNTVDVVKAVGTVSDVSGPQNLSVRATDSRTNNKIVSKSVTVLPYESPAFVPSLVIKYTNNYDTASGLTITASGNTIANISPLTLSSVDKNEVVNASGVKFDMSKNSNTAYTGSWTNVATTQTSGTGAINATLATLASAILTKMNTLTADNTVRWYVKFQITDKLETIYYETYIDIGRSMFRLGTDGYVYFNEIAYLTTNSITSSATPSPVGSAAVNQYYITALAAGATIAAPSGTPTNGNRLMIRIKDNGTARALIWNAIYRAVGTTPPATTVVSKTIYVGFIYNSADSKWDCVTAVLEA